MNKRFHGYFILIVANIVFLNSTLASEESYARHAGLQNITVSAYLHAPSLKLDIDLPALEARRDFLAAQLDSMYKASDSLRVAEPKPTVSLSYQVLALFSYTLYQRVMTAYTDKNLKKFLKHAADFTELAEDLDHIAGVAGDRRLPRQLHTRNLVVWKEWFEALHTSLLSNTPVDEQKYVLQFSKLKPEKMRRRDLPETEHARALARLMFEKYKFHLVKNYLR